MSESQFNYTVIEQMHKSPIWDNHILKVRVRGKDKIYVLKLYGGINEPFQKLVFNREMEALKVLNSCSNIVKIRDTTASLKYNGKSNYGAILMDYVDGKTLDLYDWHSFTQLKKYEICLKILQAVYNAHANDVIHRDLKPQNIIYDDVNDEITIIDFGSSKIKTIIEKETTMPMFSENYSAPEVVKGNDITEKCDYYSLGVIFSELFLCKEAESNVETICLIEKSSMDEVLKDMLCSMLQDNPSDRPESIDEITDVFTQLIGELNTSANDYSVFIDFEKMRYLKRSMVIENSMNMTQFTNSFLKREFSERYGYYDEHHGKYIITGKNIVVECSYDEKIESFEVMRIFEVATDRRNINIRTVFYGGTIDTGCKDEDKLHGLSRYEGNSIIWFDTSENRRRKQKKTKGNSFMNEEEKRIILDILEDLKKSNELDNQDIGIITGYSGQKDILRNSVKAIGYDKIAQIDINVLDAFQGRENDIIMYSTVRTDNSIGFQKEKERVNVAFSRAKKLLIICGDLNFFYNYNDPNNKFIEIIDYIRTHDHCKIISCKGGNLF